MTRRAAFHGLSLNWIVPSRIRSGLSFTAVSDRLREGCQKRNPWKVWSFAKPGGTSQDLSSFRLWATESAWPGGSWLVHFWVLQGIYHCDIISHVLATRPPRDKDICWPSHLSRQQEKIDHGTNLHLGVPVQVWAAALPLWYPGTSGEILRSCLSAFISRV